MRDEGGPTAQLSGKQAVFLPVPNFILSRMLSYVNLTATLQWQLWQSALFYEKGSKTCWPRDLEATTSFPAVVLLSEPVPKLRSEAFGDTKGHMSLACRHVIEGNLRRIEHV